LELIDQAGKLGDILLKFVYLHSIGLLLLTAICDRLVISPGAVESWLL
jgi:hypothetical protein